METTRLTADNVHEIFKKLLFKDGEATENHVKAQGIMINVGFHPDRLKENEPKIKEMLSQLPDEFQQGGGGGYTFLNMCNNKDGEQWADMHQTMDELLCMGIAIDKVSLPFREIWSALPGGMPYVCVKNLN